MEAFDVKVSTMSGFVPLVTQLYKTTSYESDVNVAVEIFKDGTTHHSCYVLMNGEHSKMYAYRYWLDGKEMMHRIGGPCNFTYNSETGKLTNLVFALHDLKLTEERYWLDLSQMELGKYNVDCEGYYKEGEKKRMSNIRALKFHSKKMMVPSVYYKSSNSLVYKIAGKKVNRSTFYKCLEQRQCRIKI